MSSVISDIISPFFDRLSDFFEEYIINPLYELITWIGQQLWNSLIYVIDKFLEGAEWFLNYIRGYLKYAITIVIAWLGISRAIKSERMSIGSRILSLIFSPIAGAVVAEIFDKIVPVAVTLPRLRPIIIPPEVSETFTHEQYTNELVIVSEVISISEEYNHLQSVSETTVIIAGISTHAEYQHEQYVEESVTVA